MKFSDISRASSSVGVLSRNSMWSEPGSYFCSFCLRSSTQYSSTYPGGISCALFSRKSPNDMRMSPRKSIFSIWSRILIPCSTSLIFTTSPPRSLTIGVSTVSTNAIVAPFPGTSSFICVPTATVWCRISATTGCIPTAAKPVLHARPYLSLKPPILFGSERTDLPAITSLSLFEAESSSSPFWTAPFSWPSQSQPSSPYSSILLRSFFALPIRPSFRTRRAPPRTRSVLILAMFLWFTTSFGSVSTPSSSTGRLEITVMMSSSSTWYWKLLTSRS